MIIFSSREISLGSIRLNYYESGSGKSILFLHGGRLRALSFRKTLTELAKSHHVLAPDIPGYGGSSTPKELWTFKDYAEFFRLFLDKLGIDEVTVIGYSLGGGIAYHLTSISPKIKKLILIDAACIEANTEDEFKKDVRRLFFYLTHPQYGLIFLSLVKEYLFFSIKHLFSENHIGNLRKRLNESSNYVKNITIPTVILWGKNDEIFPFSIAKELNQSIKGSTLTLVEGNHDWPLYKNEEFTSILKKYIPTSGIGVIIAIN